MEAVAHSRFVRFSARKINQVLKIIRGQSVEAAYRQLPFIPRVARVLVEKTLMSAVANSRVEPSGLFVAKAWVGLGPPLKRVRAHAMGSRAIYKRKTSHLTIVVSDQKNGGTSGS
jgi:large subunit ribosomal protein L22